MICVGVSTIITNGNRVIQMSDKLCRTNSEGIRKSGFVYN